MGAAQAAGARPLALTRLVLALFAIGRFLEFFLRSDLPELALGLEIAQWKSLLAAAAAGAWLTLRAPAPPERRARGRGQRP